MPAMTPVEGRALDLNRDPERQTGRGVGGRRAGDVARGVGAGAVEDRGRNLRRVKDMVGLTQEARGA
ncbi:hypothetical protein D3C86_2129510 [compost metagenome]